MKKLKEGLVIYDFSADGQKWQVSITSIYNPSPTEIEKNKAYNDTLGNFEPDQEELPVRPFVQLECRSSSGEIQMMWWDPLGKVLGPDISRKGWTRSLFYGMKSELCKHRL